VEQEPGPHKNVYILELCNTSVHGKKSEPEPGLKHIAFPEPDPEPHPNDVALQHRKKEKWK
jgi:hypothetical protein